jgi:N-acetylglucosamine malate deacetylase 1
MASILIVGPHPDDQELGMGGTIALLAGQGHRVTLLDLTNGEPTPKGTPEVRAKEAAAAAVALSPGTYGQPGEAVQRVLLDLPNRRVEHTLAARHKVAGVIRAVQAEVVFVPYFEDAHPDHLAATRIAEDARFDAKLTGIQMPGDAGQPPVYPKWLIHYYATHLRIVPRPSFLIDISSTVERKQKAIAAYRSQFELNPKNVGVPKWIAQQDAYMGSRIGTAAAEAFFAREPIGLNGLGSLVM